MGAIYRRELKAYFTSPIGYIFIGVAALIFGVFFTIINLNYSISDVSTVFSNSTIIFMILIPILTMRLFSEERKLKTDQVLITAPVSITGIVLGKFFAAATMVLISLAVTVIYAIIVAIYGTLSIGMFFSLFLGFFLMCTSLASIGIFLSSLTENQVVAAVSTFGIFIVLYFVQNIASMFNSPLLQKILGFFALFGQYQDFYSGLLGIGSILYYLSVCCIFVFLTIRVIEKRRWS